ncbi:hypothetical protein KFK09_017248 [Dendrobium nobile]|uniref:Uncharacterized protein n=1 Tax=Dendrobium nobile TaxID=94219 RepID=A0A8T3B1Q5_DENNO|nr:hypothetical protein KFK09_017248 [Dendrobium nobile]
MLTLNRRLYPFECVFLICDRIFFSPRILHDMGSLFGKPLKTDNATVVGSRPSVARVLMELDITKQYPDHIWLGPEKLGYVQSMEMEELPKYCGRCKSIGHSKVECGNLNPKRPVDLISNGVEGEIPLGTSVPIMHYVAEAVVEPIAGVASSPSVQVFSVALPLSPPHISLS